jgi:hypothetical protein
MLMDGDPPVGTVRDAGTKSTRDRALRASLPSVAAVGRGDERILYLGDDADGVALEVMAVELSGGALYVIHAMPLRERYRPQYEEAKKWRL